MTQTALVFAQPPAEHPRRGQRPKGYGFSFRIPNSALAVAIPGRPCAGWRAGNPNPVAAEGYFRGEHLNTPADIGREELFIARDEKVNVGRKSDLQKWVVFGR